MIRLVDIDSVRASTYNPRKADPKRLDYIELSLRKLGFLLPIYADTSGEILSGHQRHFVAKRMGVTKIPVEFVKRMSLEKRKSYNIVFNRATNDLKKNDTSRTVTDYIAKFDVEKLADSIPDIEIDTDAFYPCLNTKIVDLKEVAQLNVSKMHEYAKRLAGTLLKIGVKMPIVLNKKLEVMNGIGRVQYYVEKGEKIINAVILDDKQADFSNLMLNYISMDFDLETRYADTLRYNSFMRSRNTRSGGLGDGFYKGIYRYNRGTDFSVLKGEALEKWKKHFGTSVVDFGAGKLSNTMILRRAGIKVSAFEPYFIAVGEKISKKTSLEINRKFLKEIADGRHFDSIFISSVFNSVPFMEDRKQIATICAALCDEKTQLIIWTQGVNCGNNNSVKTVKLNKTSVNTLVFNVDYEPNTVLGDFSGLPKVQKYHSQKEIYDIVSPLFGRIKRLDSLQNFVYVEATEVKPVDIERLRKAIEFEFDLPYPDGSRMGLVKEAKEAFSKRLGITIP